MKKLVPAARAFVAVTAFFAVTACSGAPGEPTENVNEALAGPPPCGHSIQSAGIHTLCVSPGGGSGNGSGNTSPLPAPTSSAPLTNMVQGCLDAAGSWALAEPPCSTADAGGLTSVGYDSAQECDAEWALWAQLQAAGCTTPRQLVDGPAWGDFYAWCPPGNYGDPTWAPTTGTPQACTVTPSSSAGDTQLVLWVPVLPLATPSGCKIPACLLK